MTGLFDRQKAFLATSSFVRVNGSVAAVSGVRVEAEGMLLPVGKFVQIVPKNGSPIPAQIVALRGHRQVLIPLRDPAGVGVGDRVTSVESMGRLPVSLGMLGCVLDGLGRPIGEKSFTPEDYFAVDQDAPPPLSRAPIDEVMATGIRSIDAMHTVGCGQRIGVFAGTGVGKSVLMGMIARNTSADVTVVALVGERGREVGDFLRKNLGPEGLARSVVVASTSNESPVMRVRAAFVATAVAEFFRDRGANVLLMMDSTTRIAMAQREIGLAGGEPPTTKGYPPSVFAMLPRLLERSGKTDQGSITGLYTVLVEGDDINEPISDAMRGILDGHIWLSRELANRAHYPAVSVLDGVSRVMPDVTDSQHLEASQTIRRVLAVYRDIEDLVNLGAYLRGHNVEFDVAVDFKPRIDEYLLQLTDDAAPFDETRNALIDLAGRIEKRRDELEAERGREVPSTAQAN